MAEASTNTTSTPPVNTQTAAPAPAPGAGATATNWNDSFTPEMKSYFEPKGFKSATDLASSYQNLEKLMGAPQDRIIKMAEKMRGDDGKLTPEARAIFDKLGAPKEAKEYQLEIPKEFGDAQMADQFSQLFFEEGLTKAQATGIVKAWNERQTNAMKAYKDQQEAMAKDADVALRKDWGQAYDQNLNIAKEAARTLGMDQKALDALHGALGQAGAMKLMHKLGSSVGEGKFVQGTPANQVMAPDQAKSQIQALMKDQDFVRRVSNGDQEATGRWQRLHEMANPGEMTFSNR